MLQVLEIIFKFPSRSFYLSDRYFCKRNCSVVQPSCFNPCWLYRWRLLKEHNWLFTVLITANKPLKSFEQPLHAKNISVDSAVWKL